MNIKKIFKNLPSYPHYRMNVFSGTNKISDIINILNYKFRHDNYIKKYQEIISYTINSENIFTFASGRMGFYTILKSINIYIYIIVYLYLYYKTVYRTVFSILYRALNHRLPY